MNQLQCPNCGGEMIAIEPNRTDVSIAKKNRLSMTTARF